MDDESSESTQRDDVTGVQEEVSQRQRDWDEVDGEKEGAGSTFLASMLLQSLLVAET